MIFKSDSISFHLMDVLELKQKNVHIVNTKRNFNALSLRLHSDAYLETKAGKYHLQDNSVAFFPARLDYTRVATVDEMIVIHLNVTNYTAQVIEYFESTAPERLIPLFRKILDCWNKKESGYRLQCSAILYEIFAECYLQNAVAEGKSSKIRSSVEYLHQNYKNPTLTMQEVAAQSFISEVYFRKLFKKEYGISPQKYIIDLRIQNAASLISTGYYSLKEIAYLSGYTDYKYFSVEFKRVKGVSPSEYLYNYPLQN